MFFLLKWWSTTKIETINDVIIQVYKEQHSNIRSPLMTTLDSSVETLDGECNLIGLLASIIVKKLSTFCRPSL